jgi:sulfur-carrier protein
MSGIQVTMRYFANVRESLGKDAEMLTTSASTVAALRAELIAKGEPYAVTLSNPRLRAAVNHMMVGVDAPIDDGDEVAFFPPVTGG